MSPSPTDRLLELLRRRLGAADVRLVEGEAPGVEGANVVECALPDGRRVRATLPTAPADRAALEQKMALLVESFRDMLGERASTRPPTPPASTSLDQELEALVARVGAVDALVIDARSPIVWGDADEELSLQPAYDTDVILLPRGPRRAAHDARGQAEVLPFPRPVPVPHPGGMANHPLTGRAFDEVRARPERAL
jgi:hypothetical protein